MAATPQRSSTQSSDVKPSSISIKAKQTGSLLKMVNLMSDSPPIGWKVLIYDRYCRDIIAPLLRVAELRKNGVTLHLMIDSDRQAISDVTAVYFVQPTESNIRRICQDCSNRLYDSFHLNFSSSVPRNLLEEMAQSTLQSDSVNLISKVHDQYLNFVSLEDGLFTLNQPRSYVSLHNPTLRDAEVEANIETISNALFSMVVTLGQVPFIRCPRGEAAEMVAQKLSNKLREHILEHSRDGAFSNNASSVQARPVLIILDRSIDIPVILHHTWTYQALVHDLLGLSSNRIKLQVDDGTSTGTKVSKQYDLDDNDDFWKSHAHQPFPKLAEDVDNALTEYKTQMEDVTRATGGVDLNDPNVQFNSNTTEIASAINQLPILARKKQLIDMHTNIAHALLSGIKERELDTFFGIEESIMTRDRFDKKELQALLGTVERGTLEDKLRLMIIYYLCTESMPSGEMEQYQEFLKENGVELDCMDYLRTVKQLTSAWKMESAGSGGKTGLFSSDALAKVWQGGQKGIGLLAQGVKNLLPANKTLPVTRIVESIMDQKEKAGSPAETFLYYDPKMLSVSENAPRSRTPYRDAIVFVIGGGNYVEYANLQEYATKKPEAPKNIVYGSTEIVSANEFISQLAELGKLGKQF